MDPRKPLSFFPLWMQTERERERGVIAQSERHPPNSLLLPRQGAMLLRLIISQVCHPLFIWASEAPTSIPSSLSPSFHHLLIFSSARPIAPPPSRGPARSFSLSPSLAFAESGVFAGAAQRRICWKMARDGKEEEAEEEELESNPKDFSFFVPLVRQFVLKETYPRCHACVLRDVVSNKKTGAVGCDTPLPPRHPHFLSQDK